MKCIKCGKYPFCSKIENSQQEACKDFIKRTLRIKITPISISNVEIKFDRLKTINKTPTKKATLPKISLNLLSIILILEVVLK